MSIFTKDKVIIAADRNTYWQYDSGSAVVNLVVDGTTVFTSSSTGVSVQKKAATAVTATADGLTTGLIPAGTQFVSVTSASVNNIITLPAGTVGDVINGWVGANGCEIRTPAGSNATINNVDADGTNEAAIPATSKFTVTLVAADTWILEATTELGAVITAIVPN